jgi:tetratricopeptide (TPR) repeat protein
MRPDFAEAFNNIAASQIMLGNYDAAIAAANEAVRINPQVELYRNNLAWAYKEKGTKAGK